MAVAASTLPIDLHAGTAANNTLPPRQINFDDDWLFSKGDMEGAQRSGFRDDKWSKVTLPHDWSIEGPFSEDAPGGGTCAYLPTGIGWYRKRFTLPPASAKRKISVQFDGIYQCSEVWINGHYLGMRPNGYVSFVYDLTPYLEKGSRPNILAVRVDNSLQPNSRWYSGSGIYRHAWLIATGSLRIAPWGTCVRTPEIGGKSATVEVITRVQNDLVQAATCMLRSMVQDKNGNTVGEATTNGEIDAEGDYVFAQSIQITSPTLWSVDAPYLYQVYQVLERNGQEVDATTTPFGVRSIAFDIDKGFLLNNERVKLNGVCVHGDAGAVGAAVPERMWQRRLTLLKEMGCNAIRMAHNPPAPQLLDLCDRMGFY
ncbi:MAG TPA: glycoside hydrolase family 2 TIM barrel-domain containing protein, partial [Acidobacteriaceae bacterium]|nr:glycoside hydrolase family 2 TIM barrel-domain containing protein [Acidobacteriaceae bacterium]